MGQAVTEDGAISAAAAFCRCSLAARAWAEDRDKSCADVTLPSNPSADRTLTTEASLRETALLRLALIAPPHNNEDNAAVSRHPLVLVVSREPGPHFCRREIILAEQTAVILGQNLRRVRAGGKLGETKEALELSLRGMKEASTAVSVLVEDGTDRAQEEIERFVKLKEGYSRKLSKATEELGRVRNEADSSRRRLIDVQAATAVVADAVISLYASVVPANTASPEKPQHEQGVRTGDDTNGDGDNNAGDKVYLGRDISPRMGAGRNLAEVIESAAGKALHCPVARVGRTTKHAASVPGEPLHTSGTEGGEAVSLRRRHKLPVVWSRRTGKGGLKTDGQMEAREAEHLFVPHCGHEEEGFEELRVGMPYSEDNSDSTLSLSLHRPAISVRGFDVADEAIASTLVACLGIALFAVRPSHRVQDLSRLAQVDREGGKELGSWPAASFEKVQERVKHSAVYTKATRPPSGMSKARVEADDATNRAEQHTAALRHLLAGLHGATECNSAMVARVVAERAAAAVPGCIGAVLLTPRPKRRLRKAQRVGRTVAFSPDPRVWANVTAAAAENNTRYGANLRVSDEFMSNERKTSARSRRWAEEVAEAAFRAVTTCRTTHVDVDVRKDGRASADASADASPLGKVLCFSPIPPSTLDVHAFKAEGKETQAQPSSCDATLGQSGKKSEKQRMAFDGHLASSLLDSPDVCHRNLPCVIAWMCNKSGKGALDARVQQDEMLVMPSAWSLNLAPTLLLPRRVSRAIEGVVHAVGLALSTASTGPIVSQSTPGRRSSMQTGKVLSTNISDAAVTAPARTPGSVIRTADEQQSESPEEAHDKPLRHHCETYGHHLKPLQSNTSVPRHVRKIELKTLQCATSVLEERVQGMEKRAAELRESEARSSLALASARADVMAVNGELQLTLLERDYLRHRLSKYVREEERENEVCVGGRERNSGRQPLGSRSMMENYLDSPVHASSTDRNGRTAGRHPLSLVSDQKVGLDSWDQVGVSGSGQSIEAGRMTERGRNIGKAVDVGRKGRGVTSTSDEIKTGKGLSGISASEVRSKSISKGASAPAAVAIDRVESKMGSPASPSFPGFIGVTSSEALQQMASVHAKLSDCLRGEYGRRTGTERQPSVSVFSSR